MSNWFANIFGGSDKCCCNHCDHDSCCGDKKEEATSAPKVENKPAENADKAQ